MIEVIVRLRSANTGEVRSLATMLITNDGSLSDGSGNSRYGAYDIDALTSGWEVGQPQLVNRGRILRHQRNQWVWALVKRAIEALR